MQRLLSLATLAVMGGLGFLFLKGGGLDQVIVAPRADQSQAANSFPGGSQAPSSWGAPGNNPATQNPSISQPQYQPTTNNGAALPVGAANGPTIRIASFNIQVFGNKKASKPYVMNTLAEIVRKFDVVAIQEIRSKDQYLIPNFVQLINQQGRKYDHVIGPRLGVTTSKEQYVYLFDTERIDIDHQSVYTVGDPDGLLHRPPLVATFRTRGVNPDNAFTFTLVNTHTDPDLVPRELAALAEVYRVVRRSSRGEDDIILLGDLNTDDRRLGRLGQLPSILPLITGVWTNTKQNKQYDNLIIHQPSTTEYTGRSGVFNVSRWFNLTQQQATEVSDHFPVWAEFSVYERDLAGRVASHRRNANR
ncbi:MAG: endonuclease/exonuclease/phosphatase [Planctomycetes bacterium]|nr:endonuclease/exonuclease/phosphatase [Planctomycetota bacterium]